MSSAPATKDSAGKSLSRDTMRALFESLGKEMAKSGEKVEIALYGGAAIILSFGFRESTSDADFVRISGDSKTLEASARKLAGDFEVAEDWLNDSVSTFASDSPDLRFMGDFPRHGRAGLRIFTASPQYLFAMKCLAMRGDPESHDPEDLWDLADACEIETMEEAMDVFESFYPDSDLPRRNRLLLGDVFEAKAARKPFSKEYFW